MTHETMTIHRALAELKLLDSRIDTAIETSSFCTCIKHGQDKVSGKTISQFRKDAESALQKITDLINRRNAIKQAVSNSNSQTTVQIAGKTYTVASAIAMKQQGMVYLTLLRNELESQYTASVKKIETSNAALDQKADDMLQKLYGTSDKTVSAEILTATREAYVKPLQMELVDSIHIESVIENLTETIDSFMSEVDSVLSTSNAVTEITIDY